LILAYAAFLALTLFFRGRALQGPWWFLLRSFLPNWRFYHRVGAMPVMLVRTCGADGQWSAWQGDRPRARRALIDLVHNPHNNRLLLDQSLVEHLYADLREADNADSVTTLVSYRLACELARRRVNATTPSARAIQFEIRLIPPYGVATPDTAVLTSPVLAAGHAQHPTT
ncbi:MAG: hypothetical protein ACKO8O_04125, partial [Betaproteobacteria bacterium]